MPPADSNPKKTSISLARAKDGREYVTRSVIVDDEHYRAEFIRRLLQFGSIDHPYLGRLFSIDLESQLPSYSTDFAEKSLADSYTGLQQGKRTFTPSEKLAHFYHIADAIGHLHEQGIFHGDISTTKLRFERERIRLFHFAVDVDQQYSREKDIQQLATSIYSYLVERPGISSKESVLASLEAPNRHINATLLQSTRSILAKAIQTPADFDPYTLHQALIQSLSTNQNNLTRTEEQHIKDHTSNSPSSTSLRTRAKYILIACTLLLILLAPLLLFKQDANPILPINRLFTAEIKATVQTQLTPASIPQRAASHSNLLVLSEKGRNIRRYTYDGNSFREAAISPQFRAKWLEHSPDSHLMLAASIDDIYYIVNITDAKSKPLPNSHLFNSKLTSGKISTQDNTIYLADSDGNIFSLGMNEPTVRKLGVVYGDDQTITKVYLSSSKQYLACLIQHDSGDIGCTLVDIQLSRSRLEDESLPDPYVLDLQNVSSVAFHTKDDVLLVATLTGTVSTYSPRARTRWEKTYTLSSRVRHRITDFFKMPEPYFAAAHADGSISIWSLEKGLAELFILPSQSLDQSADGHSAQVWSLAFDPKLKAFLTVGYDNRLKVWRY